MSKLKLLFLSFFFNNKTNSMYNPAYNVKPKTEAEQIGDAFNNNNKTNDKFKQMIWYKNCSWINYILAAGLVLCVFLQYFLNSTNLVVTDNGTCNSVENYLGPCNSVQNSYGPCNFNNPVTTNYGTCSLTSFGTCNVNSAVPGTYGPCNTTQINNGPCDSVMTNYGICDLVAGTCQLNPSITCTADANCKVPKKYCDIKQIATCTLDSDCIQPVNTCSGNNKLTCTTNANCDTTVGFCNLNSNMSCTVASQANDCTIGVCTSGNKIPCSVNTDCVKAYGFCDKKDTLSCTNAGDCVKTSGTCNSNDSLSCSGNSDCIVNAKVCSQNQDLTCSGNSDCSLSVEESTKSSLGLGFQLATVLFTFLTVIMRTGFSCNFLSISKMILIVFNIVIGVLCLAGETLGQEFLAGLTGNTNITTLGLVISIIDLTIGAISLMMMIFYHYASGANNNYSKI